MEFKVIKTGNESFVITENIGPMVFRAVASIDKKGIATMTNLLGDAKKFKSEEKASQAVQKISRKLR